jgi:hypothetical protein
VQIHEPAVVANVDHRRLQLGDEVQLRVEHVETLDRRVELAVVS